MMSSRSIRTADFALGESCQNLDSPRRACTDVDSKTIRRTRCSRTSTGPLASRRSSRSTKSKARPIPSPKAGQGVTIEGVVVGDYQGAGEFGGFYLQEEDATPDADPATSEGIFVFDDGFGVDVAPGDIVRVRGTRQPSSRRSTEPHRAHQRRGRARPAARVHADAVSLPVATLERPRALRGHARPLHQTLTATEIFTSAASARSASPAPAGSTPRPRSRPRARPRSPRRTERPQPDHPRRRQQPAEHRPDALPAGRPVGAEHAARRRHGRRASPASWTTASATTGSSRSGRSTFDAHEPADRGARRRSAATSRSPRSTSSTSSTATALGGGFPTVARREHAVRARPPAGEGGQRADGDRTPTSSA